MTEKTFSLGNMATGRFIENDRFNTTFLCFHFYLPLNAETMTEDALLPYLISSCSKEYESFTKLNMKLLSLYGAELACSVSKSGDWLHTKIGISVINNEFAFEGEDIVGEAVGLLQSLIFEPAVENGSFNKQDIEREKRKTVERIESEINNKRSYAKTKLISAMFPDEAYGRFIYGTVDEVEKIDGEAMFGAWKRFIEKSIIELNVVSKTLPLGVFESVKEKLSGIDRTNAPKNLGSTPLLKREEVAEVTEYMNVTQGKLCMGFSSDVFGGAKEALPLMIFTDVFGGGPYSYLFENVREKQSLCYYCSAAQRRVKGFITVDSGVESENADKTYSAVLAELERMQSGEIAPLKLEASKRSVIDSLKAYYDSPVAIDSWYSSDIRMLDELGIEDVIELVGKITLEDIVRVAKGIRLHTVYRLLPKKEGE